MLLALADDGAPVLKESAGIGEVAERLGEVKLVDMGSCVLVMRMGLMMSA